MICGDCRACCLEKRCVRVVVCDVCAKNGESQGDVHEHVCPMSVFLWVRSYVMCCFLWFYRGMTVCLCIWDIWWRRCIDMINMCDWAGSLEFIWAFIGMAVFYVL